VVLAVLEPSFLFLFLPLSALVEGPTPEYERLPAATDSILPQPLSRAWERKTVIVLLDRGVSLVIISASRKNA